MPHTSNGDASSIGPQGFSVEAPLDAIQEIIAAIHHGQTEVVRFSLSGHNVYLFSLKYPLQAEHMVQHEAKLSQPSRRWTPSILPGVEYTLIERIIDCACQQAKVSRKQIGSKHRSKPIALARALVAYYAHLSRTASYSEVASMMNVRVNSLYAGTQRYRKTNPQYFKKSVQQFLALSKAPTAEVGTQAGGTWTGARSVDVASDVEIGATIARALRSE